MTQSAPTQADRVLDAIQSSEFQALLEGAKAPIDDFSRLALVDLASDQQHALGEALSGVAVESLARDMFSGADAPKLAQWLNGPAAKDALIGLDLAEQLVLLLPGEDTHAVAVRLRSRVDIAELQGINSRLQARLASADAATVLAEFDQVQWMLRLDLASGAILERQIRPNVSFKVKDQLEQLIEQRIGPLIAALLKGDSAPVADRALLQGVIIKVADRFIEMRRLPFVSRLVVALEMRGQGAGHGLWVTLRQLAEDVLRDVVGMILASGLKTMTEPFPETDVEFERILDSLRELPKQDLDQRLVLGGFADHEIDGRDGVMRCRECIYYLPHRRWCDLPDLPVPVEPDWYCRLWKL